MYSPSQCPYRRNVCKRRRHQHVRPIFRPPASGLRSQDLGPHSQTWLTNLHPAHNSIRNVKNKEMPRTIVEITADIVSVEAYIATIQATDPNWATNSVYASLHSAYAGLLQEKNQLTTASPAGKGIDSPMMYCTGVVYLCWPTTDHIYATSPLWWKCNQCPWHSR